jgi:hypothetical protein
LKDVKFIETLTPLARMEFNFRQRSRNALDVRVKLAGAVIILFLFYLWNQAITAPVDPFVEVQRSKAGPAESVCKNNYVTTSYEKQALAAINTRETWGKEMFQWEPKKLNPRNAFMVSERMHSEPNLNNPSRQYRAIRGGNFPMFMYSVSSGERFYAESNYERFDYMGPTAFRCPEVKIIDPEHGQDEKRVCWVDDAFQKEGCVIFSVGSENNFQFEEQMAKITKCQIHTFDCTVKTPMIPEQIRDRVTFHKLCLAETNHISEEGLEFATYGELLKRAKLSAGEAPLYYKIDVEGWEWTSLLNMIASGEPLPVQIQIEVHYSLLPWSYGELSAREILAYFNRMYYQGGYVLAERHDIASHYFCTEILLVKVACW